MSKKNENINNVAPGSADQAPGYSKDRPNKRPTQKTKFRRGRAITVPMRKLNNGDEVAVEFTGDFSTMMLEAGGKKSAATIARIINMDTGAEEDLIVGTVLHSTLGKLIKREIHHPTEKEAESKHQWTVSELAGKKLILESLKRDDKNYYDVFVYVAEEDA